jgi:hypothetical protein
VEIMACYLEKKKIPNPGSDEALDMGCSCPVLDNHHGKGFPWPSSQSPSFWINETCKLHNKEARTVAKKAKKEGKKDKRTGY